MFHPPAASARYFAFFFAVCYKKNRLETNDSHRGYPMRNRTFFRPAVWVLTVALFFSWQCARNPVTGKKELMLISEKAEINMGRGIDEEIRREYGLYEDVNLSRYIRGIGMRMVPFSHRPRLEYHFAVLDTPVVNAFAAPGGYIYVTRGLLALMNSEAEVATVIGHELGHVAARHSARQMSTAILVNIGLAVGSALDEDIAKFAGVASLGFQLLFLKFSRDDEYQADSLGVQYSRSARYRPREMAVFFRSLLRMEPDRGNRLPSFLSTHPLTEKRIARLETLLQQQDDTLDVRQDDYFARIDGLVYGEDPRQGYLERQRFYHPGLGFSFHVPQGWEMQNTPRQLLFASKDGKAALVVTAESSTETLDGYIKAKVKEWENAQYLTHQSYSIRGFQTLAAQYHVPQGDGQPIKMQFTCIRKNDSIITFAALSEKPVFANYYDTFDTCWNSFEPLTDRRYLNRAPQHVVLVRADGLRTLQEILSANGAKGKFNELAILNALQLGDVPPAGRRIKVVK